MDRKRFFFFFKVQNCQQGTVLKSDYLESVCLANQLTNRAGISDGQNCGCHTHSRFGYY